MTKLYSAPSSRSRLSILLLLIPTVTYAFLNPITNRPITSQSYYHQHFTFIPRSKKYCSSCILHASNHDEGSSLDEIELIRIDVPSDAKDSLEEYLKEWAQTMFLDKSSGSSGLTTPVNVDVRTKGSVKIVFKATSTGSNYQSLEEERELENRQSGYSRPQNSSKDSEKVRKEGGVEVLVDVLVEDGTDGWLRVKAKRCNMDDNTTVKEMSEEVIIKKLQKAVSVWMEKD